jgi:hypothetical protein
MRKFAIVKFFWLALLVALPRLAAADSHKIETSEDVLDVPSSAQNDAKKITVGEIEDVILVPWSVTLPARIDTGAAVSSLDARNITVRNNMADFMLGKEYGDVELHLPVVGWSQIQTSVGSEKRPVVEIGICLGSRLFRTLATLRDRSQMTYPFLVGRNVLNGGFVVDTSRSRASRPACPSNSAVQQVKPTRGSSGG